MTDATDLVVAIIDRYTQKAIDAKTRHDNEVTRLMKINEELSKELEAARQRAQASITRLTEKWIDRWKADTEKLTAERDAANARADAAENRGMPDVSGMRQQIVGLRAEKEQLGDTVMNLTADLGAARRERDDWKSRYAGAERETQVLRGRLANPLIDAGIVGQIDQVRKQMDDESNPHDKRCLYCDLLTSEHTLEEWRSCVTDLNAGKDAGQ